jgi:lysophospholipase L1-like esterase
MPVTASTVTVAPVQSKLVVFMGDSITAYWGPSLPVSDASDVGVPGETSDLMYARFKNDVLDQKPTTVVILAGTNDIRHNGYSATQAYVQQMANDAAAAGIKVILGTVPPINDWVVVTTDEGNALVAKWNSDLKTLALQFGYQIADYHSLMVLPDGTQNASLFNADHLHPDAAGYVVMWKALAPVCADCVDVGG